MSGSEPGSGSGSGSGPGVGRGDGVRRNIISSSTMAAGSMGIFLSYFLLSASCRRLLILLWAVTVFVVAGGTVDLGARL